MPSRNPVAHSPDARPRISAGAKRTSIDTDATVNIVEPMPPSDRNTSSCQYSAANAQAPVDDRDDPEAEQVGPQLAPAGSRAAR